MSKAQTYLKAALSVGLLAASVAVWGAEAQETKPRMKLGAYYFAGWANGGCAKTAACVVTSTSPLQGLGGPYSPAAFFYPISGGTP